MNILDYENIDTLTNATGFSFYDLFSKMMSGDISLNPTDILNYIISHIFSEVFLNMALIRNLVVITILSALLTTISSSFKNNEASKLAFYACYIAIITILFNSFYLSYLVVIEIVDSIYNYTIASTPLITSAILLSGNPSFLAGFNPMLFFFTQTVIVLVKTVLLPFILCIASLDIINKITDKDILSNFTKTGRQVITWSLKTLSALFMSVLAIIRVVAPITDGIINKTAKTTISFVPVVGSSLSNAYDTAIYIGKSTKNGAMVALLIALIMYIGVYIIKLTSFLVVYKAVAIIIEPVSDKKISKVINLVGDYVGYFIGASFFVCSMFVFSVLMIISL